MKARHLLIYLVLITVASLTGCAQQTIRSSSSASLSKMIKPVKDSQQITDKTPLVFPASVAIVTVPTKQGGGTYVPNTTLRHAAEKLKQQLLAHPKYVTSVAVVEHDDVATTISLERIRALYSADIAILLSYQQDQRSSQKGGYGLLDAAIVGFFLVPGVEINTASVVDGKVIHIPSNAVIFRASGNDDRSSKSTSYEQQASFTKESLDSIVAATNDFGNTLVRTLGKFDHFDLAQALPLSTLTTGEADSGTDFWRKVDTYKATGGGAFGLVPLLITAATCWAVWRRK